MSLLRIPKGLFKFLIFLIFLGVGLAFAIIRTQAGRNLFGVQIETAFSNAFAGSLEIGRLSGNVLTTLYAIDVTLRDPEGHAVVHVDTLIARLSIFDALKRDITIRTAEFVRPSLLAVRDDSGSWNLSAVFQKRSQPDGGGSQWRLKSADVRVRGGRIQAINRGNEIAVVQSGRLFDYANARYEHVRGRLTVEWGASDRLIDVINLGGRNVDTGVDIEDFHGQLVASDSTVNLSAVRLKTTVSSIELSAALSGFKGFNALIDGSSEEKAVHVHLDASNIDSTEVALLFPSVHVPSTSVSMEITGARSDLNIRQFAIQVGNNRASGFGSIRGLPDVAEFNIDIEDSSVDLKKLAWLAPGLDSDLTNRTPRQHVTAEAYGTVSKGSSGAFGSIESSVLFQAESRLGLLDGTIDFRFSDSDNASYTADLNLFEFRIGRLIPEAGPGSVWNGRLGLSGQGLQLDELNVAANLDLSQSSIRNLFFDDLKASIDVADRSAQIDLGASGPDGDIKLASTVDFSSTIARIDASASMDQLNLVGAVADPGSADRSEFTARSHVTVSGSSIDDLSGFGIVAIDTVSLFSVADTVGLPPSEHHISLSHSSANETKLTVRGDVLEGELEGLYTFSSLSRVISLWLSATSRTAMAQRNKRLHFEEGGPTTASAEAVHDRERDDASTFLLEHGFTNGLYLKGGLRINRLLDLHRLVGELPTYAANIAIRTAGRIAPDDIDLQIWIDADSLRGPTFEIDDLRGEANISGAYDGILEEFVASDISIKAARVGSGRNNISDLSIGFHYADRAGSLTVDSRDDPSDPLSVRLEMDLTVLPDRNEVVVSEAYLRRVDYAWQVGRDAVFDVFGDAVRIQGFSMINQHASDADHPPQRVAIAGVISDYYADTLNIEAQYVSLDQVSDLADFRDHLGGELDASIAVAQVLGRPELIGDASVRNLSYVYRDVGDLRISSTYSGQGESLFVDAEIIQPREEGPLVKGNNARVSGTIAIPGPDSSVPFGTLDIALDASEVDLFFFGVLFATELRDVSGKAAGTGTVTGVLSKPIFNADIQVLESDFLSPAFNLQFGLSGRVTVDSLGFHLHDDTLTDPTGGRATLRGDLFFNDYRYFSFDLSADLVELMIMNVKRSEDLAFYGEVWVSGSATLTGPLQRTLLRSTDIVTSQRSRLYLPVTDDIIESDQTYIVFTDSTGAFEVKERRFMLDARPKNERAFVDGMDMNFNITIPNESNVYLVFDALLGDVIQGRGSGRVQFQRFEGDYSAFGTLTISSGDYLFTAGEVFQRRFILDAGGTITWDGDPIDAALAIPATYRTRASLAGLPGQNPDDRVPIRVNMNLAGRLSSPEIGLRIALDVNQREGTVIPPGLEVAFNREDLAAEYATSVLLTNTFLLTSSSGANPTGSADDLLFNSLSHLVSSQLNRFVNEALDLDVNVGVQQGRTDNAYDLVYGFALHLDEQGLIIRGEGLYETTTSASSSEGLQGEFVVEYKLTPGVRIELFFRRESDLYQAASSLGTSYGVGLVYQTDFANWKSFGRKSKPADAAVEPGSTPLEDDPPSSEDRQD